MASNAKRKTTMAKLNREAKLREKRIEKQARKDARKREAAAGVAASDDAARASGLTDGLDHDGNLAAEPRHE